MVKRRGTDTVFRWYSPKTVSVTAYPRIHNRFALFGGVDVRFGGTVLKCEISVEVVSTIFRSNHLLEKEKLVRL